MCENALRASEMTERSQSEAGPDERRSEFRMSEVTSRSTPLAIKKTGARTSSNMQNEPNANRENPACRSGTTRAIQFRRHAIAQQAALHPTDRQQIAEAFEQAI